MLSHPDDSDDGLLGESTYEILSDISIPSHSDDDDDDLSSLASLAEDEEPTDEEDDDDDEEEDEAEDDKATGNIYNIAESISDIDKAVGSNSDLAGTSAGLIPDVPDSLEMPGIPTYTGLDRHETASPHQIISDDESIQDITIRFLDDAVPEGEQTVSSYDLHEFKGPEFYDLRSTLSTDTNVPNLHSVLRCALGTDALNVGDGFKIMYVGAEEPKEEIITKIAAALVVHTANESIDDSKTSARFNVVPVTQFGNNQAAPEVELVESFGLEMVVDTCVSALNIRGRYGRDIHMITRPNAVVQSIKKKVGYQIEPLGWRVPDLGVIYCPENDAGHLHTTRSFSREFFIRHEIPFIQISEGRLYHSSEDFHIDPLSIHMDIETRETDEDGTVFRQIYKELPLDLQSFLSLDVQQLSRNLAVIILDKTEEEHPRPKTTLLDAAMRFYDDFVDWSLPENGINFNFWALFGVLTGILCLSISLFATGIQPASNTPNAVMSASTSVQAMTTTAQVAAGLNACNSKPTTKVETPKYTVKESSSGTSTSSIRSKPSTSTLPAPSSVVTLPSGVTSLSLTDLPILKANESKEFTMYTISDGHIVLRSPQKLANLRRPPSLIVHVKRRNHTVPVEVTELFRGVYAIKMDLSEAWGSLNITVRTQSRPILNQSFALELGNPWLSKSAWKRSVMATSSDLRKAMNKASSKANVYAQKFQEQGKKRVDMARKDVQQFQKQAFEIRKDLERKSEVAKRTFETQLKAFRSSLDELKIEQYIGTKQLKEYSKQIDAQVQRARKNAKSIWVRGSKVTHGTTKGSAPIGTSTKKRAICGGKRKGSWKKSGKCRGGR